jgi:hypothetical protein
VTAGEFIFTTLSTNEDVSDILGSGDLCRVYPLLNNESYELPYVTYQNIYTSANATKSGVSTLDEKIYQINIVATTPFGCVELTEKIRAALDYSSSENIQQCFFEDERDTWVNDNSEDGSCMIQQDYRFLINR